MADWSQRQHVICCLQCCLRFVTRDCGHLVSDQVTVANCHFAAVPPLCWVLVQSQCQLVARASPCRVPSLCICQRCQLVGLSPCLPWLPRALALWYHSTVTELQCHNVKRRHRGHVAVALARRCWSALSAGQPVAAPAAATAGARATVSRTVSPCLSWLPWSILSTRDGSYICACLFDFVRFGCGLWFCSSCFPLLEKWL